MAYRILYGSNILWDPYSDATDAISDTSLTMSTNAAKYLDFTMPPTHSLYNVVAERSETVWLYAGDKIIYKGFISGISTDIYGYKSISCTSVMDYLKDTHVRDYSTIEGEQPLKAPTSLNGLFQWYIDQHNKNCMDSNKMFTVGVNQAGNLDSNNYVYRSSTQFPTTAEEIENKILDYGGYIFERYDGTSNILDFYSDAHEANTQILDFGVNITDFTRETSTDDQYTAVYATGYTPDPPEDDPEKEMKPISLADIQNGGSPYNSGFTKMGDVLYSVDAVQRYGYREYYYSNDDITTTDYLLKAAGVVLNKLLSPSLTLDVKAVDMALFMDNGYEHLQLGQAVRVRSKPHNTDEYLMISGIDLDLQDPGNTSYTIGTSYDTLTGQQSSYLKSLNANINSSLDSVAALGDNVKKSAKDAKDAKTEAAEAAEKAKQSEQAASEAQQSATNAEESAKKAQEAADKAEQHANDTIQSAKEAADSAAAASKTADDLTARVEVTEKQFETVKQASEDAVTAAGEAKSAAGEAADKADEAYAAVGNINSQIDTINSEISNVKSDATKIRDDLSGQITTVKQTMEADYAKTTDLTTTEETLRTEISTSATGVLLTVSSDYTKKTEFETLTKDVQSNAQNLTDAIKKFDGDINSLQGQIDGSIQTWFYEVVPTNQNEPAVNWTTTELKNNHLGDLYYDTKTGYCYRYQVKNNVYSWERITDVDVTKALSDAAKAQDTADHKRRVFVATPTPPYDVGDLWVQGTGGDIMRCTVSKTDTQTYAASDWVKASKYTDDSAVTNLSNYVETNYSTKTEVEQLSDQISQTVSSLETVNIDLTAAKKAASDAKSAAEEANTAAGKAQSAADTANENLKTAQNNLDALKKQADASDEQIKAAEEAVAAAKEAANKAQTDATQAIADAKEADKKAQQAADDLTNLTNRVTQAETSIKQNSDAIALRATKTEVTDAVNDISVGGRNLLLNSLTTPDANNISDVKYNDTVTQNKFCGRPACFTPSAWRGIQMDLSKSPNFFNRNNVKIGDIVTASVYCMIENDSSEYSFYLYRANNGDNTPGMNTDGDVVGGEITNSRVIRLIMKANTWYRLWCVFSITDYSLNNGHSSMRFESSKGNVWWSSPKVEIGNKPTDWSPAPEDLVSEAKSYSDSQLTIKANEISSTVSSVKTTAESANTLAGQVRDNLANNYSTTTQMNSAIKQSSDSITSTVSETYTTKKDFNNLNVGGRNLILDTGSFEKTATSGNKPNYFNGILTGETYNGCAVRKNTVTNSNNAWEWTVLDCKPGELYTFSFWVKGNCDAIRTYFYGPSGYIGAKTISWSSQRTGGDYTYYSDGNCDFSVSNSWQRVWVVYELNPSRTGSDKYILIRTDPSTVGKDLYLAGAKLEKGNKPTDWSPAPEDLATSTEMTSVKQTVSDLTTTISSVKSTADAAKSSTTTLETLIRQSGDGVEVAKKVNGSYTSTKTLAGSDGFYVQDSSGTNLTQIKASKAIIGKETGIHSHVEDTGFYVKNDSEKNLLSATADSVILGNVTTGYVTVKKDEISMMNPGAVISGMEYTKQIAYFAKGDVRLNGGKFAIKALSSSDFESAVVSTTGQMTLRNNSSGALLTDACNINMAKTSSGSGSSLTTTEAMDLTAANGYTASGSANQGWIRVQATNGSTSKTGSSLVSINGSIVNINGSTVNVKNNTLSDFVISEGTSGDWYYRKWYSGFAECWCKVQTSNFTSGWAQQGSNWVKLLTKTLPFTAKSFKSAFANCDYYGFATIEEPKSSNWLTKFSTFICESNGSIGVDQEHVVQMYWSGTWK